jgi:hypothetical protein
MLGCSDSTDDTSGPQGPGAPTLNSPANGATNVAVNPTTFRWTSGARAVSYTLQVAMESQFANPTSYNANADTFYAVSDLAYGTTYYWRVQDRDSSGLTAFSGHYSFATIGALLDIWDARANWRDSLGVDQMRYTFATDSGYIWFYSAGSTSVTRSGTFSTTATQIVFHETNDDGTPVDTTYNRDYSLPSPYSVLTLEWQEGTTTYPIQYDRVP